MGTNMSHGEAFLEAMAQDSRERAALGRLGRPELELRRQAARLPAPRLPALGAEGFDLIAEVKFRSPAQGDFGCSSQAPDEALRRALEYVNAGACLVSVLTQESAFHGSLEHLARVAASCPIPVLRKDFPVHPYQAWEARAAGADGILVVLRILTDAEFLALLTACDETGLFALVEVFDVEDLRRAKRLLRGLPASSVYLGVNNRDLQSLEVNFERCLELAPLLPHDRPCIAESGMRSAEQVARAAACGYRAALVGSAFMGSSQPGALLQELLSAGREARGARS